VREREKEEEREKGRERERDKERDKERQRERCIAGDSCVLQGGEDPYDAYLYRSFPAKEPHN